MYAVVFLSKDENGFLQAETWSDDMSDIQVAEKVRSIFLVQHPHINPQNLQVVTYS